MSVLSNPAIQFLVKHRYNPITILVGNSIYCTVAATLLWFTVPTINHYGFSITFMHVLINGQMVAILTIAAWAVLRVNHLQRPKPMLLSLILTIPLGYHLGLGLAHALPSLEATTDAIYSDPVLHRMGLLFTAIATLAATQYFIRRADSWEFRRRAKFEKRRAAQSHMAMLRAQIEPHMLFNTLANIRSLVPSNPTKAVELLDLLDNFFRATLHHSREANPTLASEFHVLEQYLKIMHIRYGDRLTYDCHLPDEIKNDFLPSMLVQPIVENSVKHGIEPSIDGGHIEVSARRDGDHLVITVQDTGIGYEPVGPSGFGINNVIERVNSITRGSGQVTIHSSGSDSETGTLVTISIPVGSMEGSRANQP